MSMNVLHSPKSSRPMRCLPVCPCSDDAIDGLKYEYYSIYVTICNFMPLYDELLLTVQVKDASPEGTVDLIVE